MAIGRFIHSVLFHLEKKFGGPSSANVKYTLGNMKHHNTMVDSLAPQFVKIGDNFISGPNSMIVAHDASYFIFTGKYRIGPVEIGDNVFLGAGSVVLPGVKIGSRVVIGAGSIVTHDIPDNSVAVGNPAKVICTVDEYIRKAETHGSLYKPPFDIHEIANQGGVASPDQVLNFQKNICTEYHKRNPDNNIWVKFE
jgi:maltose O-acetyltransferase